MLSWKSWGGKIDTAAMTIWFTEDEVTKLRGLLLMWPRSRRYELESEVRELVGMLLYGSEVVRPGKCFVRRMLNQLGFPPVKRWQEKLGGSSPRSRRAGRLALGPEFYSDIGFLAVDDKRGIRTIRGSLVFAAPLCFSCSTALVRSCPMHRERPWESIAWKQGRGGGLI